MAGTPIGLLALLWVVLATPLGGQAVPARIVTLVPGASSLLVEFGVADRVVGRSVDDRTPALRPVATVGRVLEPDLERIVALEPTLILAWAGSDLSDLARVAARGDARVVEVRLDRLSDLLPTVALLGRELGREPAARRLARGIEEELASIRESLPPLAPSLGRAPRILWVVWTAPPVVAGPETLPADILDLLGLENVMDASPIPWPRPSWEWLVAQDPDVVVWPVGPDRRPVESLTERSPWWRVPALARARYVQPELDRIHEVGPHLPAAIAALAEQLRTLVGPF